MKTTEELLKTMSSSRDYKTYLSENGNDINKGCMKIDRALNAIIAEKKLKKSDVIAKSTIEPHYGYQILQGRKNPTRDKVIMLCFGASLTVDETQQLLKVTGYAQLYGKNIRDNAILFGLQNKMSVIFVNHNLDELNLEPLL